MTGTLSRNTIFSISRPLSRRTGTDGHVSVSDLGLERHRQRADGKHRFRRVWVTNPEQDFVSGSDLLSPQLDQITGNAEITADTISEALDAVPLNSERSLDFIKLRDLLRAGEFQTADDESRALLLTLAGTEAQSRGWIYFTEVASIPATDLKTIDSLWKASSNDKFGYSVQRKIFAQNARRWTKFFRAIDWTVGENNNYRKWPMEFVYSLDAKPGHLPLTNCLRGTQLFEALMHHRAFTEGKDNTDNDASSSNRPTSNWSTAL